MKVYSEVSKFFLDYNNTCLECPQNYKKYVRKLCHCFIFSYKSQCIQSGPYFSQLTQINLKPSGKSYVCSLPGAIIQSGPITGGLAGGLPLSRSLSLEVACDILSTVGGVMINTVDCFIVVHYC